MLNRILIVAMLVVVLTPPVAHAQDQLETADGSDAAPSRDWPREFTADDGSTVVLYSPQIEKWDDFKSLEALAAVVIRSNSSASAPGDGDGDGVGDGAGDSTDVLGALRLTAQTAVDHEKRVVHMHDIQISEASFPALSGDDATAMQRRIALVLPTESSSSLDEVLTHLEMGQVAVREVAVDNSPPQLIMSRRPAVAIIMDGEPILEDIEGTTLKVVVNTTSRLFKLGKYRQYYLSYRNSWVTATDLNGPWIAANNLPDAFSKLPDKPRWQAVKNSLPGELLSIDQVPRVYITQPPVELLVTDDEPRFQPIPGTALLYVANTQEDIFLSHTDGMYYALFSGRWFRSQGKGYPLMFCTDSLPEDFKNIPSDHPCGRVLASVPGTPDAEEAVFASLIPRTARVMKDRASVEVTYIGEPPFAPIDGTNLSYAVNTSFDVVQHEGTSYVCHEAVWFQGDTPKGPWTVCESVPAEIYEIPLTCPIYNVVYVQIFDTAPDSVVTGFLPGYLGTFYVGGVVVHGTGLKYSHDPDYYRHLHRDWRQFELSRYSFHHTYGHRFYFDHANGFFRRSPDDTANHVASGPAHSPFLSWGGAVTVIPYNAPHTAAMETTQSRVAVGGPDLYVGRDGAIYRRGNDGWRQHQGNGWSGVMWPNARSYTQAATDREFAQAEATGTSPGTWTRPTPVQRGLGESARGRHQNALASDRYANYRNSRGNRTW